MPIFAYICLYLYWVGALQIWNIPVYPEPPSHLYVAPSHGPDSDVSQLSPGNWEAIVSRQNAASSIHPCVCSVWDSEDLSKLGKSWKWELFWSRLREKGAPAPRFPFTFLTSQWEAGISLAHLATQKKTKPFNSFTCCPFCSYGHAQRKLSHSEKKDSVKWPWVVSGMWNWAECDKCLEQFCLCRPTPTMPW